MRKKVHPKVEEAVETLNLPSLSRRRLVQGAGLASASLAASALLTACTDNPATAAAIGNFPKTPKWKIGPGLPRDHQPVLHAHPVRRRGRLQAARHPVPVDRFA